MAFIPWTQVVQWGRIGGWKKTGLQTYFLNGLAADIPAGFFAGYCAGDTI